MSPQKIAGMGLFGLRNSNRDFENPDSWKKNIFNNAFPAALASWMGAQELEAVYYTLNPNLEVRPSYLGIGSLFGLPTLAPHLYFKFESAFPAYEPLVTTDLPRVDLVTFDTSQNPFAPLQALEIKLTALPDNTTAHLAQEQYGCEIVVRPDTIIYLALGIASAYLNERQVLHDFLEPTVSKIRDWRTPGDVLPVLLDLTTAVNAIMLNKIDYQRPIVLQPVWRTIGQRLLLAEQCFDVFVWSDYAFTRLFMNNVTVGLNVQRPTRTIIWLARMLYDFACTGNFDGKQIVTDLTYGPRNDKAFSVTGIVTRPLMACPELSLPRVSKQAVREILLGGGQDYLQPERRLDAAILTTPGLFAPSPIQDIDELPKVLYEPSEEDQ